MKPWHWWALLGTGAAVAGLGALALSSRERSEAREAEGGTGSGGGVPVEIPGAVNLTAITPTSKRHGKRPKLWALVLHQMGFSRGSDPMRYKGVTAHFIVLPDGTIAQLHPIDSYLYAANGFNAGSVSVEFAGNLPKASRSTDPEDFYHPEKNGRDQLTRAQVAAGRLLVDRLSEAFSRRGWKLTTVLAHRQAVENREIDPGPDVWGNIGQWAIEKRGLSDGGAGFHLPDFGGKPIPSKWREARWYDASVA